MIRDYLTAHGFATESVFDGAAAVRSVFQNPPDIVVLDLNLPRLSGLDVARTITSQSKVPIIVTTARGEEDDRLEGFLSGVDDYLVKPVSLPELVLRITAILRRTNRTAELDPAVRDEAPIRVADLRLDPARHELFLGERPVELTAVQFAILERLARSPGRVFTRIQLLQSFQDRAFDGYERTIDVHIKNIRKKIEDDPRHPKRIVTVHGVGYRLDDRPGVRVQASREGAVR